MTRYMFIHTLRFSSTVCIHSKYNHLRRGLLELKIHGIRSTTSLTSTLVRFTNGDKQAGLIEPHGESDAENRCDNI